MPLGRVRVTGGVRASFVVGEGEPSRVASLSERDGYRLRFPLAADGLQGVVINTGGGVAGGDRIELGFIAETGADVLITTQSAERVYRALAGSQAHTTVSLSADAGARLVWLPQETILYDGARFVRRLVAEVAPDARLLIVEPIGFGRKAHGESLRSGLLNDQWRIRRGGRLVLAENVRLDGEITRTLSRPFVASSAHVSATLVHVAPDAEDHLDAVRALVQDADVEIAASAWNGMLVVRGLASEVAPLRAVLAVLVPALTGRSMPRVWQT